MPEWWSVLKGLMSSASIKATIDSDAVATWLAEKLDIPILNEATERMVFKHVLDAIAEGVGIGGAD